MSVVCTIVGMHFVPPAKALIEALPAGAALTLVHDETNQYSAFAVKVFCSPLDVVWTEPVEFRCIGMGHTREELCEKHAIMLGHIGENKVPEGLATSKDIVLLLNSGAWLEAQLGFSPEGKPLALIEKRADSKEVIDGTAEAH